MATNISKTFHEGHFLSILFITFAAQINIKMKKITTVCLCLVLIGISTTLKSQTEMTTEEKYSYAIGANMGTNLKNDGVSIDTEAYLKGLRDGLAGNNQFSEQ